MLSSHFSSPLLRTNVNAAFKIIMPIAFSFHEHLKVGFHWHKSKLPCISKHVSQATFAGALMLVGRFPVITRKLTREALLQHLNVFAQMKTSPLVVKTTSCLLASIADRSVLRALESYIRSSFLEKIKLD